MTIQCLIDLESSTRMPICSAVSHCLIHPRTFQLHQRRSMSCHGDAEFFSSDCSSDQAMDRERTATVESERQATQRLKLWTRRWYLTLPQSLERTLDPRWLSVMWKSCHCTTRRIREGARLATRRSSWEHSNESSGPLVRLVARNRSGD